MITIQIETEGGQEDYLKYPSGIECSFDETKHWLGVFNQEKKLLGTIASKVIVHINMGVK